MLFFLLMTCFQPNSDWVWRSDDIFHPLTTSHVHFEPDGSFYISLFSEKTIRHYHANGQLLTEFGGAGEGPGEFRNLFEVFHHEGQVFALDVTSNAITVFTAQGQYLRRWSLRADQGGLVKTKGGWIYGDWHQFNYDPEGLASLYWTDEAMAQRQKLFDVKGRGAYGTFVNDGVTSVYSPVSATTKIAVNGDGSRVFVADANGFRIRVLDPSSKKVIHTINREARTLPFNPDWANIRLNQVKQQMPNIKFVTNYPESFPVIRRIFVNHKGWLVIDRWTQTPHKTKDPIVLDDQGKSVSVPLDYEFLTRWVGNDGDQAYLTTYDETKQLAGMVKVPTDQAYAYVKANRLPKD